MSNGNVRHENVTCTLRTFLANYSDVQGKDAKCCFPKEKCVTEENPNNLWLIYKRSGVVLIFLIFRDVRYNVDILRVFA